MVYIVPLLPIAIALFLIATGVFGEIQSNLDTLNTILMVIIVVVFVSIAIYNLTRRYVSPTKKVFSTISCAVLGVVSGFVLKSFLLELASINMDILGVFEFAFVGFVGGCISLLIVLGCIMACCWFSN